MIPLQRGKLISNKWWFHVFLLVIIYAFLARYFFFVGNYTADPWYQLADADAAYAPQTVLLLNDGDGYFFAHPGATIYFLQGIVHRALALFNNEHRRLMQLSEITSPEAAVPILTTAVDTGRIISLLIVAALASILYFLILKLTQRWFIAFTFTFFIVLSKGVLWHNGAIRPESPSVVFFWLAALLCVIGLSKKKLILYQYVLMFFLSGLSLGLAVFSKVQIVPVIILLLFTVLGVLWLCPNPFSNRSINPRHTMINLILAICAVLLTPYWALARPAFLTLERFNVMDINYQAVYGSLPANFFMPVLAMLLMFLCLSTGLALMRSRIKSAWSLKLLATSLTLNLVALGIIASVYIVLLPASLSLDGYVSNTNHLVYATLTNLTRGGTGFLTNMQGTLLGRIVQVLNLHGSYSTFATFNILYLVGIASLVCCVRLIASKLNQKVPYVLILGLFTAGLGMDLLGTLRMSAAYNIYAIYSVGFYGLGLAYFASLEVKLAFRSETLSRYIGSGSHLTLVGLAILAGGALNVGLTGYSIVSSPIGSGIKGSYSAETAWQILDLYVPQFKAFIRYAALKRAVCFSGDSPQSGKNCGFPGGVHGWLDAAHESLRGISTHPKMAGGEAIDGWWLLGYDVDDSQSTINHLAKLKMYWSPSVDVEPTTTADFYRERGNHWAQVVSQSGSLVNWRGPDRVNMQDLHVSAPPLALQGNVGDFTFSRMRVENSDVIRVSSVYTEAKVEGRVIQFGPRVDKAKDDLDIRPGQVVIVSLWARLSEPPVPDGAGLFIQDKTDTGQMSKISIGSTTWRQYAVFRKIRNNATDVGIAVYWRPKASQDWLEIKGMHVFVFDSSRPSEVGGGPKDALPLRPVMQLPASVSRLNQDIEGWQLLGYDVKDSHLTANQLAELKIYWSPPIDVEPTTTADFYRERGNHWAQVVSQSGSLVNWRGPDRVNMQDLHVSAPPLALQGNVGDFTFSRMRVENSDVIRVSSVYTEAKVEGRVIQFGPRVDKAKDDLDIRPGQVVIVSLWARLSEPPVPDGAGLFIQDRTDTYQMSKTPIDSTAWSKYIVFREVRDNATNVGIGVYWRPKNSQDWLEIKGMHVFVFDTSRPSEVGGGLKATPPLRPVKR